MSNFLELVNMALLEKMFVRSKAELPKALSCTFPVFEAYPISDWDRDKPQIAACLTGKQAATPTDTDLDKIPTLSDGAMLLTNEKGVYYFLINGQLRGLLTDEDNHHWIQVLKQMDGVRTLSEIIEVTCDDYNEVKANVRLSMKSGLVKLRERGIVNGGIVRGGEQKA